MIDVKELSIGSFVLVDNSIKQVDLIGQEFITVKESCVVIYFSDITPVTINEEWLIKFGFKYKAPGIGGQDQWAGYGLWELSNFCVLGGRKKC